MSDIKTLFNRFDEWVGDGDSGRYGSNVEMYTESDGNRVFCVRWYEQRPDGGWDTEKELFAYSPEGLESALAFSDIIHPKWVAYNNREIDCR